jgi:hypothetical protein
VQPYDQAGTPPPEDPTAELPDGVTRDSIEPPPTPLTGEPEADRAARHSYASPRVDTPRYGRPIAPNLFSRMTVGGLILAAVLVAAGVTFVWGDHSTPSATPAATKPTGQQTSNAVVAQRSGISDLLARRAKAVRDHDKAAFLALIDPTAEQFRVQQGALFDRLVHIPLSQWTYELAGDGPALPKNRVQQLPKGSMIVRARLDYELSGSDSQVERDQYLTVVPRGGQWLLAGDGDATASGLKTDYDIWDLGPVQVVHGKASLVLGDAPANVLRHLATEADQGVNDVGQVWTRTWSRRPVIVFPKSQSDMATLIGSDGKGLSQIAAVTTGSFESGLSRGDRVVVNPDAWHTLGPLGRRVVLAHEMTHLATRAITVDDVPIWLSEGFADYVAYSAVDVPTNVVAGDVLDDVRAGKGPSKLPDDAEFDAAKGDIASAYEGAWLACRMIAERYGQKKLIALYVSYANNQSVPAAGQIKSTLGISQAQLVKQWLAYLNARAGV